MTEQLAEILKKQYNTEDFLRIRQETHDKYTVPNVSFAEWALRCVSWKGDERVLDVGAGNGLYYAKLKALHPNVQYVGMDLFEPMLQAHPALVNLSQADALALPYPSHSFDVVMANHMLFHVTDIERALSEIQRVLKPGGTVMTATNSVQNMPELQVLMRRAIVLLSRNGGANVRAPGLASDNFALENGTRLLARHFYAVVRHDLPSALVFPDTEPAMAYLESTRDLREAQLPDDVEWDDVMVIMRQQINQLVKHLGELVINKQTGVLIASDTGGFIRDFLARKNGNA
jgi:SAM-dependent methyltransferase